MAPYRVLITHKVLLLARPAVRERQEIYAFLEGLAHDPFQKGDYEEMDEIGRPIEIKIIGRWALTFWSDHAVREVKVIRVEKADRD